jgi:hypothetical protein
LTKGSINIAKETKTCDITSFLPKIRSNTIPDFPQSYKRRMVKYTRPLRPRPDPTGKIALMKEQLRNKQPWTFEGPRPKLETMKDQLVAAVDEKYPRMTEIMRLPVGRHRK